MVSCVSIARRFGLLHVSGTVAAVYGSFFFSRVDHLFGTDVVGTLCVRGRQILYATGQLWRALIARRAIYIKPLFWQALEQCIGGPLTIWEKGSLGW